MVAMSFTVSVAAEREHLDTQAIVEGGPVLVAVVVTPGGEGEVVDPVPSGAGPTMSAETSHRTSWRRGRRS